MNFSIPETLSIYVGGTITSTHSDPISEEDYEDAIESYETDIYMNSNDEENEEDIFEYF